MATPPNPNPSHLVSPASKKTKIITTLGPASFDKKTLRELILAGARQHGPSTEVATLLGFADGVFIAATEGEDAQVERWQHALAQQGATYLGWIQVREPINAPAADGSWRSPNVQRLAG